MNERARSRRTLLKQVAGGASMVAAFVACGSKGDDADEETSEPSSGPDAGVPSPVAMYRSSWSTDPFAGGSYSYMAVGATPDMRRSLSAPVGGRLFFAGEATAQDHPSTVHGAQESARRAAREVVEASQAGERVVVIGAGAAGVATARLLTEAGFEVVVVEARDRVGGRLHTVITPDGTPLDMGASWVHDIEASDLAEQLTTLGLAAVPFDYDDQSVADSFGGVVVDVEKFAGPTNEAIEEALEWAESIDRDVSMMQALERSGAAEGLDRTALELVDHSDVATEFGASLAEMSSWWGFEEGSDGDDLLVVGGYDGLVKATAAGLDVELGRPINRVAWNDAGVLLTDNSGTETSAARVVVTVPLGVLKSGSISFEPALPPEKAEAIARIGMGLLDKVWFEFDEVFWTNESLMWNLVAEPDTPYREWFNLAPLTGKPILLALLGGPLAREWATRSDEAVRAAALASLQRFIDAGW